MGPTSIIRFASRLISTKEISAWVPASRRILGPLSMRTSSTDHLLGVSGHRKGHVRKRIVKSDTIPA